MSEHTALITQSLIARSLALHDDLSAVLARSRALLALGHERRLSSTYPRLRPISGGDDPDTALVIEALTQGATVCLECLVKKTGVAAPRVTEKLAQLERVVVVTVKKIARCDGCPRLGPTYRLGKDPSRTGSSPAAAPGPRTPNLADRAWRLLTEHRGKMLCTLCLAAALDTYQRLDGIVSAVEGRGARRQHGPCARCGKDRLLCGVA